MGCPQSKTLDIHSGTIEPIFIKQNGTLVARSEVTSQTASSETTPTAAPKTSPAADPLQVAAQPTQATQPRNEAIAIVGIGCRTPGADNIREFWRVLKNGENHVIDVPADRWNGSAFLDPDPKAPGKSYVQRGGFLKNFDGFDNGLYGINDFEAAQMDPQQVLLLECTSMALEDAGIPQSHLSGSNTGVFVGSMNCDKRSGDVGITSTVDNFSAVGVSPSVMAGRLSYVFNLLGPSMVLDTACSSALLAIHQACLAIHSGDCDMAVCAGVNTMQSPEVFCQLSKARMISPSGQCYAFSNKADGYVRGEGCGVVILKRLDDALRDGDKIWATIYTGTNQDGRTVSPMTAPSGEQQKKLLHAVYDKFQVDVSQIDYIEAHGTGTPAGDPVEVNALGSFFKEKGSSRDRYIGSLKTNIGHTESAAGILSLIKICLMMKYDQIVPSLNCEVVNPKIDLADLRFIIPKPGNTIPWSRPDKTAGCNSFGFSGSNCHAVLKSHCRREEKEEKQLTSYIVCFSGKSQKSLKDSLTDFLADDDAHELKVQDVSYTSTARRHHFSHRVGFLVEDMQDLQNAASEQLSRDQWSPPTAKQLDVVFVFCGMGTAWTGMCRELLTEHRVFREAVLEVEKLLTKHVSWSLTERLQQEDVSTDLLLSPIAIFACQVGLAAVWQSLGIMPACVVGQSIGEVAAAYTAGCLSLANAVDIIYHRSKLLSEVSGGAMIVVLKVEVNRIRQALKEYDAGAASIALEYSKTACAVSASADVIPNVKNFLRSKFSSEPMQLKDLDVSVAYHSPHVIPCANKLASLLADMDAEPPKVPMQSTVTGTLLKTSPNAQYWVKNLQSPVLFNQAITGATSERSFSTTVFLEIGPKPVLQAHLKDLFPGQTVNLVPSMIQSGKRQETDVLNKALIALYQKGADIKWKALPTKSNKITEIPRSVFERTNQMKKSEMNLIFTRCINVYQKNHLYTCPVHGKPECYELMISPLIIPSIYDHVLSGTIVVPGAFTTEASLAVASYLQMNHPVVSIQFNQLAPLKKKEVTRLVAEFQSPPENKQKDLPPLLFRQGKTVIASAQLLENAHGPSPRKVVNLDHIQAKCKYVMEKKEIYSVMRKLGFEYGPTYSLLQHAGRAFSECLALLTVSKDVQQEMPATTFHPSILDGVFQTCLLALKDSDLASEVRLPRRIGRLVVHHPVESSMYVHTCLKQNDAKESVFDMQIISPSGLVIAEIKDFVVRAVQPNADESGSILLTTTWSKVSDSEAVGMTGSRNTEPSSLLFIKNSKEVEYNSNDIFIGNTDSEGITDRLKQTLNGPQAPPALVLVFSSEMNDSVDSDSIHREMVNMCCLVRDILQTLRYLSVNLPFYFCTFNAWPAVNGEKVMTATSPAATALWGLLRTVNVERVYPYVAALELHLPSTSCSEVLPSIISHLVTSEQLRSYTEVLVTKDEMFVNLVVKNEGSPFSREILGTDFQKGHHTGESQTSEMFVPVENQSNTDSQIDVTRMRVHAFALAPGGEKMETERTGTVTAEIKGELLEGQGTEIASCCPVIVKPEVSVPTASAMPTSLIPDYQLGDLSKLVIFWELRCKTQSQTVTILASAATLHLAELLKLMCCTHGEMASPTVTVVMLENLYTSGGFNDTVISLVLLDSYLLSDIKEKMTKTKVLIACSSLMPSEALSLMFCFLPDVEVIELNFPMLFRAQELTKSVPQVLGWIKDNKSHIAEIVAALHHEAPKTSAADMNHLLVYNTQQPDKALHARTHLKKDAAYIVVGGLTGLGWTCVEFLAYNNAGYIAILNRRAPTDEHNAAIEKLSQRCNCQIQTFQCDITSMKSLKEVLSKISSGPGSFQVRGVFMGAAQVQDGPFFSMTREAFESVLNAKVKGAWNLHQLFRNVSLDHFVLHSSIASVLGNQAQANYCAGNAFLDGLAEYRRQQGLAAQAINWGPLDMGLLDNQDYVKSKLESRGFLVATRQEVLHSLKIILSLQQTQSVPASMDAVLFAKWIFTTFEQPKRFQKFAPLVGVRAESQRKETDLSVSKMKSMSPETRAQAYENYLQVLVSSLMMMDVTSLERDTPIGNLGMDSMNITMMLDFISRDTTFTIPQVEILQEMGSISSIAKKLSHYVDGSA